MTTLADHFFRGGDVMWAILACSVVMLAAALTGIARLWAPRPHAERLVRELDRLLALGLVDEAVLLACATGRAAGRIALAGLRECLQERAKVEAAVACALVVELPPLRVGARPLATTMQLATLFGLLGTIVGVAFRPFHCGADATSRACALARGISESMNCTAFGLAVSACSLGFAGLLDARRTLLERELAFVARAVANRILTHRTSLRWLGARATLERPTYRSAA